MAHSIFGDRFVGARTPAWHALGTVIPEGTDLSVEDAIKLGGIDHRYESVPVGYTTPDGAFVQSGDRVVVLREPTHDDPSWRELGVVSSGYEYIQNLDLARGLDALSKATGWKFETVGSLNNGGTVFLSLRTGRRSIFGDAYDTYVIVSDGKASARALQIAIAAVRVVCANTLMMSDEHSTTKITISHNNQVTGEYDFWIDMIAGLQKAQDDVFTRLEALASVKITDKQAKAIFDRAYPLPGKSKNQKAAAQLLELEHLTVESREAATKKLAHHDRYHDAHTDQAMRRREGAFDLYQKINLGVELGMERGNRLPDSTIKQIANSPYAAFQSVAELVDWAGRGNEHVLASNAIFGTGAQVKRRAFDAALKYAK